MGCECLCRKGGQPTKWEGAGSPGKASTEGLMGIVRSRDIELPKSEDLDLSAGTEQIDIARNSADSETVGDISTF